MSRDPIDICAERCAEFGEPPCAVMDQDEGREWKPCAECLRDAGLEVPEPLDPDAVVRPLL